jgi:hypothetical protein
MNSRFAHLVMFAIISMVGNAGCSRAGPPREPLTVRLDERGPFVILATKAAQSDYTGAIAAARELHPGADVVVFDPAELTPTADELGERQPRYALLFIKPDELDVNFGWRWLTMATQLDDDPFVDVRSGFITGATPEAAERFVRRIAAAVRGEVKLPGKLIDNLGPNTQAKPADFFQTPGNFMIPPFTQRCSLETVSHGTQAFNDQRLQALDGAGIVHFGGHGHPDRIDDGLLGSQASRLKLAPCVVFNGACYTGVTDRWYEQWTAAGTVAEHRVNPEECFCLNLLDNQSIAYLAALHPDHGVPVYQEMEYMAWTGASLGDVMKYTHDGVVLGAGGQLPDFKPFTNGAAPPNWTPADVMLRGTAARVLFGDPALIVGEAFLSPPVAAAVEASGDTLTIVATVANPDVKCNMTDTYHADLAWDPNGFNDRALVTVDLPADWQSIDGLEVVSAEAGGKPLRNRLVAWGIELDGDRTLLHAQVDVPSDAYMQSALRAKGSKIVLQAKR